MATRRWIVVGDVLAGGGQVVGGSPFTDINGFQVARAGDPAICFLHGPTKIASGDPTVIIDGQAVARENDCCACGCKLISTRQFSTFIEDMSGDGGSQTSVDDNQDSSDAAATVSVEARRHDEQIRLETPKHGPLANVEYTLRLADGQCVEGCTDEDGHTHRIETAESTSIVQVELRRTECPLCNTKHEQPVDSAVVPLFGVATNASSFGESVHPVTIGLSSIGSFISDVRRALTLPEPLRQEVILEAMRDAWRECEWRDSRKRHEEGGYYGHEGSGAWGARRWPRGGESSISAPPLDSSGRYAGLLVVGDFHVHPHPVIDERGTRWKRGPSAGDLSNVTDTPGTQFVIDCDYVYSLDRLGWRIEGTHVDVLKVSP